MRHRSRPSPPLLILLLALLAVAIVPAAAAAATPRPAIDTADGDSLLPGFRWGVGTYGARCLGDGLSLTVAGANGWTTSFGSGPARAGDLRKHLDLDAGEGARITFEHRGDERRVYVRCVPEDMGDFRFERFQPGGPRFFTIQLPANYAAVLSRDGAPVWWLPAEHFPFDAKILRDGDVAWNGGGLEGNVDYGRWELRSITGRNIRTVSSAAGGVIDIHDHLSLPNGNDIVGVPAFVDGVDVSDHGGPADAEIRHTVLEELTPDGELVRSWDSGEHIGLDETPDRWWPAIVHAPRVDVSHWNAIDVDGRFMYLSFRHLDAIYKVNRKSGRIVWKLGGTKTAKSLEVHGDPRGAYPLGAQHDVNVLKDGTVTVFDNSTALDRPPRGVRYRINERRGTARMVEQVKDPNVVVSGAGGSARRIDGGWLVGWGVSAPGAVGAYDERGKPVFRLTYARGASYRANPVPEQISGADLRRAMNRMARRTG
ncbi:MAG TPA: aryl-sulfate sulfotransferase [Solirubrobacterales bacterium]|nr:aryl-sulfate sulfotransferase [Solirubrobacterales bacterium]